MAQSNYPAIPEPTKENLIEVCKNLKEMVEILTGQIGDDGDQHTTKDYVINLLNDLGLNTERGIKEGTSQSAATAKAGEIWADSDDDYTLKKGQ